jgi:hypothetical protein
MPTLKNPGHESFAQARAKGMGVKAAYVEAGYRPDYGSASKVGRRKEVVARVAELRLRDPDRADPAAIIAQLLQVADSCLALNSAAALKEARLSLLEAHQLRKQTAYRDISIPPRMSQEDWIKMYARPD